MNPGRKFLPWALGGVLLVIAAAVIAWAASRHADAGDSKGAKASAAAASAPVTLVDGVTVIEVSSASQHNGGIVLQPLPAASAPAAATSYGVTMDMQPLSEWRAKFAAARAQAGAARTQAATAAADFARTRALHDDDQNASLKSLQAAKAAADEAKANVQAAEAALDGLRQQGTMQFGARLVADVLQSDQPTLLLGQRALLRVALAAGVTTPSVAAATCGGPKLRARWIAPAPQADAQLGAHMQLYEVDAALPANASCTVTFPASASMSQGVQVPLDAVVWFADQPWVYVQRDDTHFARTLLAGANEQAQGFFVPDGLRAGQKVVTRGAGLLLSVEQAPPPGSGSGCKDPECDD